MHLILPQVTDVLLKLLVTGTVSALVWLATVAEAKWSAYLKSLLFNVDFLQLNKHNSCQKKDRSSSCEWGGQRQPRPCINCVKYIFNTVKLEKIITCINTLILTALLFNK